MIRPPYLKAGSRVGIVSTARKITSAELQPFLNILVGWGLQPVPGDTIDASRDQYAGDDELRTKDLQRMLDDPDIDAIWCARGGYGTVRIIDRLNFDHFIRNPKWVIGYSDITVLHSHIHGLGIETIHANMASEMDTKTPMTAESARQVLFGEDYKIEYTSGNKQTRPGMASGQLVGGNLSVLYSILGSASDFDLKGKILFIEDLDEYLYHIDRMLVNLKRNGWFDQIAGLIVGGMSDMNDNTIPFGKTANEIVADVVDQYDFPVCFDFPAGHIQDNRALIMGRMGRLDVGVEKIQLDFTA